jgi:tellurite resistance protein
MATATPTKKKRLTPKQRVAKLERLYNAANNTVNKAYDAYGKDYSTVNHGKWSRAVDRRNAIGHKLNAAKEVLNPTPVESSYGRSC